MLHKDSEVGSPVFEKGYPCWEAVNQERYHEYMLRRTAEEKGNVGVAMWYVIDESKEVKAICSRLADAKAFRSNLDGEVTIEKRYNDT